uniref:Gag-Pol polyprotein n=1 Tax=Tanacetum cinerariifolium TaxID=118510 RepID=A0A6L2NT39_TANCI|nr:hypothetical protein [Tanacetum cinerariifolium]
MSVKYPNYVNLTSSSEEQLNERTPSPPPRKKSLSPPQASAKSISSISTHYTSSSSLTGSRDLPPMLATGRYAQWRSRFLQYIDTRPNGDVLKKCILNSPYTPTIDVVPTVAATDDSSAKEAIHLILSGIRDEIYSTVDACKTAQEMWEAIERLQQGESLNIQDQEWSRFVMIIKQQHKLDEVSYHKLFDILKQYQKEVNELCAERIAKNANPLALVATTQRTVNVVGARKNVGSPVVQQSGIQCFNYKEFDHFDKECRKPKRVKDSAYHKEKMLLCKQAKKVHYSYMAQIQEVSTADSGTDSEPLEQPEWSRSNATIKLKGKEIAKLITPPSESASEEDSDPEQAQRDKDMQKNLAFIAKYFKKIYKPTNNNLRTSLNSRNKNMDISSSLVVQQSGIQYFNYKEFGHFAKECRKPNREKDYTYHKKRMLLCKQAKKGVPLQVEQADWLEDTDDEIDEQELKAHYSYMEKIQEIELEKYMTFNDRTVDYDKLERASGLRPCHFTYPERRLTMEEMLYKFIDEGKREQEEMRAFIHEFRTTNELFFKERNNLLSELKFEVQGLLKVISSTPISNHEVKGVTTRGGKTTTQDVQDNDTNIHTKEPLVINHDEPIESNEVLTKDQPQNTNKPVVQLPRDDEVIFDMDQSIKRSPAEDDECYGVDDLDDAINAETQELLANDTSD